MPSYAERGRREGTAFLQDTLCGPFCFSWLPSSRLSLSHPSFFSFLAAPAFFAGLFPGRGSRKDPSRSRASLLFFSTDRARQSFPGVLSESRSRELFQSLLFSALGTSSGSPCKKAFPTGVLMDVLMELHRNASSRLCADTPVSRLVSLRHNCLLTRARAPFYPSRRQGLFSLQPHLL